MHQVYPQTTPFCARCLKSIAVTKPIVHIFFTFGSSKHKQHSGMNKLFLAIIVFLFSSTAFAQEEEKPQGGNTEIKELQAARDTAKALFKAKTLENKKNNSRYDKLQADKNKFKSQLSTAKKSKKQDKIEAIQAKIDDNKQQIKDLDLQLKDESKQLAQLEKELKNAEKALETAKKNAQKEKEKAAKEKSKAKK